jgi:hypothetical protein
MFAPNPRLLSKQFSVDKTFADGALVTEPATSRFRWLMFLDYVTAYPPDALEREALPRFLRLHCDASRVSRDAVVARVAVQMVTREIGPSGYEPPRAYTRRSTLFGVAGQRGRTDDMRPVG